jgi:hypothetical protein
MRHNQKYITPLLAALAAGALATAPIAAAAPSASAQAQQSCSSGSTQTVCQSPGNAQVFVAPQQVDYQTYTGGAT